MSDPRTDRIAREAARLIETGASANIDRAIRAAADALGFRDAPLPGRVAVRNHARAMAMQAQGESGYRESVRRVWSVAEQLMTAVEQAFPDTATLLAGRAARGEIDAGVVLHVRAYTERSIGDLAAALVELGYEEPKFETGESRFGRLDRIRLAEDDLEIVITRCPPAVVPGGDERGRDLFTGRTVATASVTDLQRMLGEEHWNR
jgi:hypothetical protein